MSTIAGRRRPEPMRWVVADALAIARRNMVHFGRVPSLVVFSTIVPVMFLLLFTYVFGGSIDVPGVRYIDFLMPGIFVQSMAFASTQTGVGLTWDLSQGMIDRFRSLPMARSAVLVGRILSDTVRNTFVLSLMTLVAVLIGFRFQGGAFAAIAALGLVVLFGVGLSWVSATLGLSISHVESTHEAGFVWLFPLTFASSAFVRVDTLPGWLQAFARINPVTSVVDAARALVLGQPAGALVLRSLAWTVALLVVFVPLAVSRYGRAGEG